MVQCLPKALWNRSSRCSPSLPPPARPHEVYLLQVVATPPAAGRFRSGTSLTDALHKEERPAAEHGLQALAHCQSLTKAGASHWVITTAVALSPDVAGAILKHAGTAIYGDTDQQTPNYDLIALATPGRTGFKRAILRSVTEHVFGTTSLPLLITCPSITRSEEKSVETGKKDEASQRWVGLL